MLETHNKGVKWDSINRHVFCRAKKAPIYYTPYAGRYIFLRNYRRKAKIHLK